MEKVILANQTGLTSSQISMIMAAILICFGLWQTITGFRKEQDPTKKQQYMIQIVLVIVLICLFVFGMFYVM